MTFPAAFEAAGAPARAARGELVRLLGEELRAREGGARRARHARDRQDRAGRARRSAGDDRHLRLRRRALAAALRPHDRVRAPGAPHARAVASARPGRRDQRVQLSGGRVGVERRARARLRRRRGLEAVGEDAAHRARVPDAFARRVRPNGARPEGLLELSSAAPTVGERLLADDRRVPLVSATGSHRDGPALATSIAARLGRSILELGGNNAVIVAPSADLDLAVRRFSSAPSAPPASAARRCGG